MNISNPKLQLSPKGNIMTLESNIIDTAPNLSNFEIISGDFIDQEAEDIPEKKNELNDSNKILLTNNLENINLIGANSLELFIYKFNLIHILTI